MTSWHNKILVRALHYACRNYRGDPIRQTVVGYKRALSVQFIDKTLLLIL